MWGRSELQCGARREVNGVREKQKEADRERDGKVTHRKKRRLLYFICARANVSKGGGKNEDGEKNEGEKEKDQYCSPSLSSLVSWPTTIQYCSTTVCTALCRNTTDTLQIKHSSGFKPDLETSISYVRFEVILPCTCISANVLTAHQHILYSRSISFKYSWCMTTSSWTLYQRLKPNLNLVPP